jgi:hypothetical protein
MDILKLVLNVVPDFVVHYFWQQPEQQPFLYSLWNKWARALLLMGMRARKLRRIAI